jgi:hypothetical protein
MMHFSQESIQQSLTNPFSPFPSATLTAHFRPTSTVFVFLIDQAEWGEMASKLHQARR